MTCTIIHEVYNYISRSVNLSFYGRSDIIILMKEKSIYLPVCEESIKQAAEIILSGGLAAFPTETVYGLGADAFNPRALAKVFEVKGRPHFDPLIIHIAAIETLENTADMSLLNKETRQKLFILAENLWPGPLSVVLPKNEKIPAIATAGLNTAAIRFPAHETAQKLISLSSGAVAAPSANPFGCLSPTRAEHVRDKLGDKIDIILNGGSARIGLESTVIDLTGDCVKILRPGGTARDVIEKLIGPVQGIGSLELGAGNGEEKAQVSPGLLKSHYAPKTALFALERGAILEQTYEKGCVYLFFDGFTRDEWLKRQKTSDQKPEFAAVRVLSESGQALEAASRLFETLHELDNGSFLRIFAQNAPSEGLGEAINDRLRRASVEF